MTKAVRYTQPLLGAVPGSGALIVVDDPAEVVIRQDDIACLVYADNNKAPLDNPVPLGVAAGGAGVSVRGELLVYLEAGRGYDAVVTVGEGDEAVVTIVPLPDISPDVADVGAVSSVDEQVGAVDLSDIYVQVAGDQTIDGVIDFTAAPTVNGAPIAGAGAITVPYFNPSAGATPQNIYLGQVYPPDTDLGPFMWRAWLRHDLGAEYWLSGGYGGAHPVLAGFDGAGVPTGNVYDGSANTSFTGSYVAQDGQWLLYDVTWDGTRIYVLIDGIVVGSVPFTGPRRAMLGFTDIFLGGSDHSNFVGALAQVEGWEGVVPYPTTVGPWWGVGTGLAAERYLSVQWSAFGVRAQFLYNFMVEGDTYLDMGDGFAGSLHPGTSRGTFNAQNGFDPPEDAHPTRVPDPTAPFGTQKDVARTRTFRAPSSAPSGAKIWDSVGRADSVPAWVNTPSMGSTEGGSLGVQAWQHDAGQIGVFDGAIVFLSWDRFARVTNDSADMDVRAKHLVDANGFWFGCVAARIKADRSTGWRLYYLSPTSVALDRPDGTRAGTWTPAAGRTKLRLTTSGTTLTAYTDDGGAGWTQLGQVTGETQNQAEVGPGLWQPYGIGTHARHRDFEVR